MNDSYEEIFNKWAKLEKDISIKLRCLRSIVQNDVPLSAEDVGNFMIMFDKFKKEFNENLDNLHLKTLETIKKLNPIFKNKENSYD